MTATSQLIPFGQRQFDACMASLAARYSSILTQRDMVKLHVMTDVYHVLDIGKPVIGGPLEHWTWGPVVAPAYRRLKHWGYLWDADHSSQPETYEIVGKRKKAYCFKPRLTVRSGHFSSSERRAMDKAWATVILNAEGSGDFFHDPTTFMGLAWSKVEDRQPIPWISIIDAVEELMPGVRYPLARQLIST